VETERVGARKKRPISSQRESQIRRKGASKENICGPRQEEAPMTKPFADNERRSHKLYAVLVVEEETEKRTAKNG